MSSERPPISVIIPTYQRRASVLRGLRALAGQDIPPQSFEVIVVVNGIDDGTTEALNSFRAPYELHHVHSWRQGRASACNAGIALAQGQVIVILDDDMEPSPNCLRNHMRNHARGSKLCVMGAVPVRVSPTSGQISRYIAAKFDAHMRNLSEPEHEFLLRDFYSGNSSISADVLRGVGLFDETFSLYGNEDIELSVRLRRSGVALRYDPDAIAYQDYAKSFAELAQDTLDKGKTAVHLAQTHPETFAGLKLAEHRAHSAGWRSLRAFLLHLTSRHPTARRRLLRMAVLAERAGAWRLPLFYPTVLDYLYWVGVMESIDESTGDEALRDLAAELGRGSLRSLFRRRL